MVSRRWVGLLQSVVRVRSRPLGFHFHRMLLVGSMALRHSLEEIFVLRLTCLGSTRVSNPFVVFDDGFGHNAAEPRLQFGPGYVSSPLALGQDSRLSPSAATAAAVRFGPTATRLYKYDHNSG